jgi:hypothetical protein
MQQPSTADNIVNRIRESVPTINTQQIQQNISQGYNNVANTIGNVKSSVSNTLSGFSSQNAVDAGRSFLNSNSIIAKFVFLILVLIIFLLLVKFGIMLIMYFTKTPDTAYVISGLAPGNANIRVSQDPMDPKSVQVLRSNNQPTGIASTWSVWLFISGLADPANKQGSTSSYSHIFSKGNANFNSKGIANVNNAPGVYLSTTTNNIRIYFDTVTSNENYMDITDVPLTKWMNLVIRIENNVIDVYVNGTIVGRQYFNDVPKQNYDDVFVGYNKGFQGQLSDLIYFDRALGVYEINNLILKGPNMTLSSSNNQMNKGNYNYLSNLWYYSKL